MTQFGQSQYKTRGAKRRLQLIFKTRIKEGAEVKGRGKG